MWTDHPHVPALERDWLLYVEKPLAVPFLSIIILLLVTKNRTLNTSPRDVKWHRSLSIVNQCVGSALRIVIKRSLSGALRMVMLSSHADERGGG